MSDLVSVFDIHYGWPGESALDYSFLPEAGVTFNAGDIVTLATMQLMSAAVLRIVDDSLVTAPTLGASDAGKAYEARGVGGGWGGATGIAIGDVVEWTGTAWVIAVVNSTNNPPNGTRAVVVEASAAGAFTGGEEEIWACSTGTWTKETDGTPADGALIDITAALSLYYNKRYLYTGTHAAGAWAFYTTTGLIEGYVSKMTSAADAVAGTGLLTIAAAQNAIDGEDVTLDTKVYAWQDTLIDADGNVHIGADADASLANLVAAITLGAGAGTDYAASMTLHPTVRAAPGATETMTVTAKIRGTAGNAIATTEGMTQGSFGDVTLTGGAAMSAKKSAWLVTEGNSSNERDGQMAGRIACIKIMSGAVIKVKCAVADTLEPNDYVDANAGLLVKSTFAKHPVGKVTYSSRVVTTGHIIFTGM